MRDPDVNLGLAVLVVLAVIGGAWYFRDALLPQPEQPRVAPPEPAVAKPAADDGPKYPVTPAEPSEPPQRDLVPLPPLDDSDSYFLAALVDVFGANVETFLVQEALVDKFVATIDNLPREHVAEKIRPAGPLSESFRVDVTGGDGPIYLSPDNYRRYDLLVSKLASADIDAVVDTYRRFYPLFQKSYERLGYPNSYFNDRLVEVIDHLLVVPPKLDESIRLVRPHVLYKFADPRLEALSSGQKLLLRMGPEHAATVRRFLQNLRSELARR